MNFDKGLIKWLGMKKGIKTIVWCTISAAVIMAAVILMILFLPQTKPESLTLTVSPTTVMQDSTKEIKYTCSHETAQIKFEVYDENVATIVEGVVIGHKVGSTSVRVTAMDGEDKVVSTASIVVTENPDGAIVDLPSQITLYLLDKNIEEAKADGFSNEISFNSFRTYTSSVSNTNVKLTKNTIVANKEGETVITFSSSTTTYSVFVKVLKVEAEILHLPTSISLTPNESFNLNYSITPSYFTGEIKLQISDTNNILSISDQTITALSSGVTQLEIKLNDSVTIIPVVVSSLISCEVIPVSNCEVINKVLPKDEQASIKFNLSTEENYNLNMSTLEFEFYGATIKRDMDVFHISASSDGYIKISAPDLASNVIISFSVV